MPPGVWVLQHDQFKWSDKSFHCTDLEKNYFNLSISALDEHSWPNNLTWKGKTAGMRE